MSRKTQVVKHNLFALLMVIVTEGKKHRILVTTNQGKNSDSADLEIGCASENDTFGFRVDFLPVENHLRVSVQMNGEVVGMATLQSPWSSMTSPKGSGFVERPCNDTNFK